MLGAHPCAPWFRVCPSTSWNVCTFPVVVIGKLSALTTETKRGTLNAPIRTVRAEKRSGSHENRPFLVDSHRFTRIVPSQRSVPPGASPSGSCGTASTTSSLFSNCRSGRACSA